MKLHLRSSGGVGGLRIGGPLDTEDLPPDLAARARELVALAERSSGSREAAGAPVPDHLEYELTWFVEEEPGREVAHRRLFREPSAPPEALESLHALMREVVRRKAATRGGH